MLKHARLAVAAAAAFLCPLAISSQAAATDHFPCGGKTTALGKSVQYCPLWMPDRGYIPVRSFEGNPPLQKDVGRLLTAGNGNWFVCQDNTPNGIKPKAYIDGDHSHLVNEWWAYTADDQGGWGWVNEIYFKDGDNNEPDAKLANCDPPPAPRSPSPPPSTTTPAAPAAPSEPPAESEEQHGLPAEPPAETVLPGTPGSSVELPGKRNCTPAGSPLKGRVKINRRRGSAPQISKVVFYVYDVRGQKVSVTVRRKPSKRRPSKGRPSRPRPFKARLVADLPAGSHARMYARVYYRWRGERDTHSRLVSRRIRICP
jgi:hypothetical protein